MERGNDVPEVHQELSNREIGEALVALSQAVTTQLNLSMMPRVNIVKRTMTFRLRDFLRMNPTLLSFLALRWERIPKIFLMECTRC